MTLLCVGIRVQDFARSFAFYSGALDLREEKGGR